MNEARPQPNESAAPARKALPHDVKGLHRAWLVARSAVLWTADVLGFCIAVPTLLLVAAVVGQRRIEVFLRPLARALVWGAGAKLEIRHAPGYDPHRTCFYVCNHVNLFDPFVIYPAIPVLFRGLELESHFRIPVYGWMMRQFGNVPVPTERSAAALKRTYRLAKEKLDAGVSLIVFPEGGRTLDGRVGRFEGGAFRMAVQLGYPIVPMSIVNSFAWKRKGRLLLRPATVTVHVHEAIETKGLSRGDLAELRERVRAIIAEPVHAALEGR